jgi:hypothetical protein
MRESIRVFFEFALYVIGVWAVIAICSIPVALAIIAWKYALQ